jgi:hypothetical protein
MEFAFSFLVRLFHPLQHAGLSRRTPKRIRTDARLVNSGHGKWAFSGDFREARIDLSSVMA